MALVKSTLTRVCNLHSSSVDGVFSMSDVVVDCRYSLGCSNTSSLTCSYLNYGTTRAMLESVQLQLSQHFSLHKNKLLSTMRQSTTTSLVENAVYTTTMEVTHSC